VAAGVAAHVSARVPLASSLIPHVVFLLGDQVRKMVATCLNFSASTRFYVIG
jgi:hypothetical protein